MAEPAPAGSRPLIVVVGSINMDLVARVGRLPRRGETVQGRSLENFLGGKGANQAVAAARAGGRVAMVGCVGEDEFGQRLVAGLEREGIDVACIQRVPQASGVALILVEDTGENCIVFTPGANFTLSAEHLDRCRALLQQASLLLVQLEIPLAIVAQAVTMAAAAGVRIILDPAPAPAGPLPPEVLQAVDIITPNLHEARALIGDPAADGSSCARRLARLGPRTVLVTLGADGVVWASAGASEPVRRPARSVRAVDATAAGDAFAGALAVALSEGRPMAEAIDFAQAAAALAVTRPGAQASLPWRREIDALLATEP